MTCEVVAVSQVMEECARQGIKVPVAGIWAGMHHVNAGSVRSNVTREESGKKMDQWSELAAKHGVSLAAVAVAFAALPSVVDKVVMGMKSAEEVRTAATRDSDPQARASLAVNLRPTRSTMMCCCLQVETNVAAAAEASQVPVALWAEAQAAGLVRADVTLPS